MVGDSNDEIDFLTQINAQVSRLWKAFANDLLANIKLSKFQLYKIAQ